jgi:pantoate--beta-alanine ligase
MGYLHAGHLSLVRKAQELTDRIVVSIFVNPIQFGAGEDLDAYPRDFPRDAALCEGAGVAVIFHPGVCDLYAEDFSTTVEETVLSEGLCGSRRPGHFRGVTTVVAKLFNAVLPDVAVFGQKDAQQARVIQRMVRDLDFPIEVVVAPIVREPDGLALSSRNAYLKGALRQDALCLRRALDEAERLFREGECHAAGLRAAMEAVIRRVPSAAIEYIEIVDERTLKPVERLKAPALIALAVKVGTTRLIDNTVLGP